MKQGAYYDNIEFKENNVNVSVVLETSFSKEIRIIFKDGQAMREHKAPYPIVVQLLKGAIEFGAEGKKYDLKEGDILTLEGNIPHDLLAKEESIVRLTLSKNDTLKRVENVVNEV